MSGHEANNNAQPKPNFRSAKAFLRLIRIEDRVEAFTIPEVDRAEMSLCAACRRARLTQNRVGDPYPSLRRREKEVEGGCLPSH